MHGEIKEAGKLVAAKGWNRNRIAHFFCVCLHFSLYCTVISSTHLNLFYLSIFLSNLTLYSWKTPHSLPLDSLFRFLMSLYLALQERRDVSFNPQPHLSCHLGHFPPSATLRSLSLPCSTPALCLFLLLWDILWHIKCISRGNWVKLIFSEENPVLPIRNISSFFKPSLKSLK